jgi:hypothetical protein
LLADVPGTGLIRIPIAVTGDWKGSDKGFSIGLDDLNEIRENFAKKPTGEINVDYEHASEVPFGTGGPVLSAGRITRLDEPEHFRNGNQRAAQGVMLRSAQHDSAGPQSPAPSPVTFFGAGTSPPIARGN